MKWSTEVERDPNAAFPFICYYRGTEGNHSIPKGIILVLSTSEGWKAYPTLSGLEGMVMKG